MSESITIRIGDKRSKVVVLQPDLYEIAKDTFVQLDKPTEVIRHEVFGYLYPTLRQDPKWLLDHYDFGYKKPTAPALTSTPLKKPWWSFLFFWRRDFPTARVVRK